MGLPNLWPVANVINIILLDPRDRATSTIGEWYFELFVRHLRWTTYIFVAWLSYTFTFPIEKAKFWSLDWVLVVLLRDLAIVCLFYGGWHWMLFESPWSEKMRDRKFNPVYPEEERWNHDRFWTISGTVISCGFEIVMLHLWATGVVPYYSDFWQWPLWSLLWSLFVPYWRDFHFYWIHRLMHPWKTKPDPGLWLYRVAHSLHHKSYNTGPWSGLSMHPIEHLIYFTCVWVPFFVLQHPFHFMFNKWHALLAPLPGHDGFDQPGGGSYYHFLHHAHFECNYGTPLVPFDKLFGTYEDGRKYRKGEIYHSESLVRERE